MSVEAEEDNMTITDAQVHIWEADRPDRRWPELGHTYKHGPDTLSAEMMLAAMNEAGVDRAVLVPPSFEGDRNDVCLAAAAAYPDRFAVMGRIPLDRRDEAEPMLLAIPDESGMLGVRLTFSRGPAENWLDDGTADWVWPVLEANDIPAMVFPPDKLDRVARIAADYPNLRLLIDHLGLRTTLKDAEILPRIEALLELAVHPNVGVKATCLASYVSDPYPHPSLHEPIRRVVDAFGPRRVFWGSDTSRLDEPYRKVVTLFTEELDFLSAEDQEWIMGRAISEWLGWPESSR
jgi:predicted TIM-barrel fold metal-dependent hydrolase